MNSSIRKYYKKNATHTFSRSPNITCITTPFRIEYDARRTRGVKSVSRVFSDYKGYQQLPINYFSLAPYQYCTGLFYSQGVNTYKVLPKRGIRDIIDLISYKENDV